MTTFLDTDFDLSESQRLVQQSIREICSGYDHAYWRRKSESREYPHEFVDELLDNGWLGALVPEAYGGAGMGTSEAVVMMEEIAANGGGFSAAQAVHGGTYNILPIVRYGSETLKEEILPGVAAGDISVQAFCLTEPRSGSESTAIETRAVRDGDEYVITGEKIWASRVDVSDYAIVATRTTPVEDVGHKSEGLSLFLVDLDDAVRQGAMSFEEIPKAANDFIHSYRIQFDGVRVPARYLIGDEGDGFYQALDSLNEDRLVTAAECVGLGELAIERAVDYASERSVFGQPIGANQAVQHPLAKAYAKVLGAKSLTLDAAEHLDERGQKEVGTRANVAKYLASEACFEAADAAVQTHGGFGVAKEYDVERYFREARLTRLIPITQELVLNYVGEKVLDFPRSY
jgi:acyl-CoA dehydrogenase